MKPSVLIICNALEDNIRAQRGITTDSPAASRKVFMLCQALRFAGLKPYIVSLGRGSSGGSVDFFHGIVRRKDGIPILYSSYSKIPFVSELISLLSPLIILIRLRRQNIKTVVYYNKMIAYLPSLFLSSFLGYRNILDLEDGPVFAKHNKFSEFFFRYTFKIFDQLCKSGVLLACNALVEQTTIRPALTYYGSAVFEPSKNKWQSECVKILMGGTLSADTGAELLIDTIRKIRLTSPLWASKLHFEVTGYGPSLEGLIKLSTEPGKPEIRIHGRTTIEQYRAVLNDCDVGLALKLNNGPLANTTFPSKVIEFAAAGLLVLTTDISDVRDIFGSGAIYLTRDEPPFLEILLKSIVSDRKSARDCALRGRKKVKALCGSDVSALRIAKFISGPTP
jgi:glycosyltransferase involved in cell wall biosynthesis